jgi:type II secretion system protein G
MRKQNKGFTLIELLIVIAIIGLLASIVLLALNNARAKSRDAKRIADVRQLATALELYFNDHNGYPSQTTGAVVSSTVPNGLFSTYVGTAPVAPTPADNTCTTTTNAYTYTAPATGATYTLTFCLGGLTGGLSAGVHTASQSGIQ